MAYSFESRPPARQLLELARLCGRNARIATSREVADELWRMAREYRAQAAKLYGGTVPRNWRPSRWLAASVVDGDKPQITYTRAAIRTTPAATIRTSASSNRGTKSTLRMGTLNQVPDTVRSLQRELRRKCELGTQRAAGQRQSHRWSRRSCVSTQQR
jgi:hypothetical protein